MKMTCRLVCIVMVAALVGMTSARADPLDEANRLLQASAAAKHFQSMTAQQTSAIIRHYEVIVAMSADVTLPRGIRTAIAECYTRVYDWELFEAGIARILASKLSPVQMRLLSDFYLSRGLPPTEIDTFKATIAMAEEIENASAEFIFANSADCVEHDAHLIMGYLRDQGLIAEALATD